MSGRIADGTIEEIRSRLDIVEVVSSYLPLKRSGSNHLGLCPFHGEKSPSFNVNASRQIFHCFGCGAGGNVFSFVMRMEGLTFPEAVRRLGERVGIEVEEETVSPQEQRRREELELFVRINEAACAFYHRLLLEDPDGAPARRYLKGRGYDGETARRFRLGYAPDRPDALQRHLLGLGFAEPALAKLGLVRPGRDGRGHYDLFRRRLLFPIFDERGRVAAFGGRVLDDGLPKYLNSSESPVYHKGSTLYGFHQAREEMRRSGEAVVVEGYFDLLALHRAGFPQTVATCGTALTPEQVRLLKRHAGKVLLLFDQDAAGRKATWRAMELLLPEGVPTAVVELDAAKDPDAYLAEHGVEALRARLAAARPVLEVFSAATLAEHDESIEGRARAVEEIIARLRLLPSEIERSLYLKALAEKTGLDEALLRRRAAAGRGTPPPAASSKAPAQAAIQRPAPAVARAGSRAAAAAAKAQDLLLQLLATDAASRRRAVAAGVAELFPDLERRQVADAILRHAAEAEVFAAEGVIDRLGDEQKALLSGILVRDERVAPEDAERVFADCREVIARSEQRRRSAELQAEMQRAEAAGDQTAVARCTQELSSLLKRS